MSKEPEKRTVTLTSLVDSLMHSTREAYRATGRELSQEALEEKMVEILNRVWDLYLIRELCRGLGVPPTSIPVDDPSDDDLDE